MVFTTNRQFVSLWVGKEYYGGNLLNIVFVYWVLQDTIYRGTTAIVYASGDLRAWTIACSAEAILNISLSLLLVGPFGFTGVALGTAISKTVTTGWYIPYWTCRKLSLSGSHLFQHSILYPMIRSIPGIAVTFWISFILPKTFGWFWLISVAIVAVATNIIMFEGLSLCRPSHETWRCRLQKMISFQSETNYK